MTTEITIGVIALALITLMTKMWQDSTRQSQRVTEVIEKNATVIESLRGNIKENSNLTRETKETIISHTKNITLLISRALKKKN